MRLLALKKTVLAAIAVSLLGSCTSRSSQDDGREMVLHFYHLDDVKTWDPADADDAYSLDVVPSVYDTLYQYEYLSEQHRLAPLLASDMPRLSRDRLTVTIPIRHNVYFQNDPCFKEGKGRRLTAHDFVFAIKRLAVPSLEASGWRVVDGKIAGINAFREKLRKTSREDLPKVFAENVPGVRAIDDFTLQLKLVKPFPQLLHVLGMTFMAPVPHEAVAMYGDERGSLAAHPVGTGPFLLQKWDRDRKIELVRNPNHFVEYYPTRGPDKYRSQGLLKDAGKLLPIADRISIDVVKERQPAWQSFLRGRLDGMVIPQENLQQIVSKNDQLSAYAEKLGLKLQVEAGTSFYYVLFNVQDPVLKNKALRQALSAAIDRDEWIEIFTKNTGQKMVNTIPPGIPDRPRTTRIKYDYDPTRAKELLRKAGYPDGKGLPPLRFDLRGADSTYRQLGEFMAQQFAAVGVKVNVIHNTFSAYLEKARHGDIQIALGEWGMDYPDPENVFHLINESNFDNPQFDALFEKMAVMEPGANRLAVIEKMDALIQEECPWALGYYQADYIASHPWLFNYRYSSLIRNGYKYYRVDREIKARAVKKP